MCVYLERPVAPAASFWDEVPEDLELPTMYLQTLRLPPNAAMGARNAERCGDRYDDMIIF